ncbi:hypothetical protein ACK33S_19240 [Aeromonas hydrophila]|uniref:hypothetical protein n=1 Tax=Aeromonas hydrophila TaxID=644 RepID=UPI003986A893
MKVFTSHLLKYSPLCLLMLPIAQVNAANWIILSPQTQFYSILKSNNEPGIAIKSPSFYGLSTAPRYTTRFDPANLQLTGGSRVSDIPLSPGTYYADGFIKEGSPLARPLIRFNHNNTVPTSYSPGYGFKKQLWTQEQTGAAFSVFQFDYGYFSIFDKGISTEFTLRSCWTQTNYDVNSTECINTADARGQETKIIFKQSYDFVFNQQPASATILIDSDGSANLVDNAAGCRTTTINGKNGVMCHLFKFLPTQYADNLDSRNGVGYGLFIKDTRLASLGKGDVLVSVNNSATWLNLEQMVNISDQPIRNDDIYLFFSTAFFKSLNSIDLSTFDINSAFYLGLTRGVSNPYHLDITLPISSNIKIMPRTVSATITSHSSGYLEGDVGKSLITFPYTIQESGPTSAEKLEISISQDRGAAFNNKCTFYPLETTASQLGVPIETYLSFDTLNNGKIKQGILCNNQPIELRQLGIKDSRPPIQNGNESSIPSISRAYDLDLVFDLTGDSGAVTTTGQNWQGKVEQTGSITFKASWN